MDVIDTKEIPVDIIDMAAFNPSPRTSAKAIRGLEHEIHVHGILSAVHAIPIKGGRYMLADGHRRVTCARRLGIKSVMATIHAPNTDIVKLWATLNGKTRTVSPFEWMIAWHETNGAMPLSPVVKGKINQCVRIFGREGIPFLIEHRASPAVAQTIMALAQAFEKRGLVSEDGGIAGRRRFEILKTVGTWIVVHRLMKEVQALMKVNDSKRVLLKVRTRLKENAPFKAAEILTEQARALREVA